MRTAVPNPLTTTRHDQAGIALMTVMMLVSVGLILAILAGSLAFHNQSASSVDRKRSQAITAAEAGVDSGVLQVQAATLPCMNQGSFDTKPTTSSYVTTYQYYDKTGVEVPGCIGSGVSRTGTPTAVPDTVLITSVGTNQSKGFGDRAMQTYVRLRPIPGNDFNKAIFAKGSLSITNNVSVTNSPGQTADVYAEKDFACSQSLQIAGSLFTQGTATMANTCSIGGDLYAKGAVSMNAPQATVGRDAKSSQGNVTVTKGTVGGKAIAKLTASKGGSATVTGGLISGQTMPDPPKIDFPQLEWNPADWQADPFHFDNVVIAPSCAQANAAVAALATAGPDTLIQTGCAMSWSNNTTITLARNVAIFSTGGFSTSQRVIFQSNNATQRRLYWIVPYSASSTHPCTGTPAPSITTSNQTQFNRLDVMYYTPCNITIANNQATTGQIYGGSDVNIANQFTLTYTPVPARGVVNSTALPIGYAADIVYKREEQTTQ